MVTCVLCVTIYIYMHPLHVASRECSMTCSITNWIVVFLVELLLVCRSQDEYTMSCIIIYLISLLPPSLYLLCLSSLYPPSLSLPSTSLSPIPLLSLHFPFLPLLSLLSLLSLPLSPLPLVPLSLPQLSSPTTSVSPTHSIELAPPVHDSAHEHAHFPPSNAIPLEPEIDKVKPATMATTQDLASLTESSSSGSRYK